MGAQKLLKNQQPPVPAAEALPYLLPGLAGLWMAHLAPVVDGVLRRPVVRGLASDGIAGTRVICTTGGK